MTDVVDRVREAGSVPRNAWADTPEGRVTRERAFGKVAETVPRNRPRHGALALVAAVLVVVLIAATVTLLSRGGREGPSVAGRPTPAQMKQGSWTVRRAGPLAALSDVHAVYGGGRLYVVGRRADGTVGIVSYDPRQQAWRVLPDSPLQPIDRYHHQTIAWSGRDVVVLVTESFQVPANPVMAAFDPRAMQWRLLTDPGPRFSGATFGAATDGLWFVGSQGSSAGGPATGVFELRDETWTSVPIPGRDFEPATGVTRDGRLLAAAKLGSTGASVSASAAPYTSWEVVGSKESGVGRPMGFGLVGRRALLVTREQGGRLHVVDVDEGWDEVGAVEMPRSSIESTVLSGAGGLFVGWKHHVTWFDDVRHAFSKLPRVAYMVEIVGWTGHELLGVTRHGALATYVPSG